MKTKNRLRALFVALTLIFTMTNAVDYVYAENEATDIYVPTEYSKNEFDASSELSDFTLSDEASDWSIVDGKLVYATDDTDRHTFSRAVNIPSGQSFAIEFKAENLYRWSNLNLYLNNEEYAYSKVDNGTQANDGKWLILVDRINGIKFFKNGVEVTATTKDEGQPYITRLKSDAVKAITNIKIGFQGSTDREAPRFDYFRVYGYGDAYTHRLSFDDASDLNYFESKSGTNTVSDGKWNVTGVKEIWPKRVGFTADTTQDLIVDFQLTHPETSKNVENLEVTRKVVDADIIIKTNNKIVEMQNSPEMVNNRIFVPLEDVNSITNGQVNAECDENGNITLSKHNIKVLMSVGSNEIVEKDIPGIMDISPYRSGDTIMIPLRAMAQNFGIECIWRGNKNAVTLTTDVDYSDRKTTKQHS